MHIHVHMQNPVNSIIFKTFRVVFVKIHKSIPLLRKTPYIYKNYRTYQLTVIFSISPQFLHMGDRSPPFLAFL